MPRSLAILAARTASMMMPAEFGGSHTSSLYSRFSGTSPKAALQADVGPLAVVEPRDVVGRADVDVLVLDLAGQRAGQVGGDGWVLDTFLDSRRSRSSMFLKSMLPPTLSW